jgi:Xaa-Pro aminopeptidase
LSDPEILHRARAAVKAEQLQGAPLANPFNVGWLTGHFPRAIGGPDPFMGGPALVWLGLEQVVLLIAGNMEGTTRSGNLTIQTYVGYSGQALVDPQANLRHSLENILKQYVPAQGHVGVEQDDLTVPLFSTIRETCPALTWQPIDGRLARLRAVKTREEIQRVRESLELCDLTQRELRAQAAPGKTEIALFGALQAGVEGSVGAQTPMFGNLAAGARSAERGVVPTSYTLQAGDMVLLDITLRHNGYWGDNAASFAVGTVDQKLRKIHGVVLDALHRAEEEIRPGLRANQLDETVREFIRRRGYQPHHHHTGHGIGVSYHEAPRILPSNDEPLQEGMVICLEPGIYVEGLGGVRIEDAVLVVSDGAQVLTRHNKEI